MKLTALAAIAATRTPRRISVPASRSSALVVRSSVAASRTRSAPSRRAFAAVDWIPSAAGRRRPDDRLSGHRPSPQVALDLEPLAVQDLPLVVRDDERGERPVDRLEGRGRVVVEPRPFGWRRAAGRQRRQAVLDGLRLGADRQVRRRRRQATGHGGSGARQQLGLARDQQVHRVDEDVDVLAAQLQHPVGHQRARAAATDGGDPFRGFRHGGRRRTRLHLETGIDDGAAQVGRHLLVGARFHDERDVRVIPVSDQRADLAPDREAGQEDQEDCQQHGQRVATQDRLEGGTRATLLLGREGEGQSADHGRQDERADEHPETHDALRHDVLRRDEEQQEGADLRHERRPRRAPSR